MAASSTVRKSYNKVGAGSTIKQTTTTTTTKQSTIKRSPPRASASAAGSRFGGSSERVKATYTAQPARRSVERTEYTPEHLDLRQYYTAPQVRLISETESFGIFPEKYDTIKQNVRVELNGKCEDIANQTQTNNDALGRSIADRVEDSNKVDSTLDTIQSNRERSIKETRWNTLEILDTLAHKNEGLDSLHEAHSNLTAKQNEFLTKEHQLNNIRHGNSLISAILARGTDLNTDREQLYSKFNEILTKDLEGQRSEVLKLLKETEDESKEVYKSGEVDKISSDIAHAIKTTAVEEIRKRENQHDKNNRDTSRINDQNNEILGKIRTADQKIDKLGKHVDQQKENLAKKEQDLAAIRERIKTERLGLVQDEQRNADLEKKLQEMKNRLRFFEQEKLYLQTESNIANTRVNIDEQLVGERDKAMVDWMKDRLDDERNKKAQLEDKMNQCYSFETKDIIDLFKNEKQAQGEQRQDFIHSLREELAQKLENEKVIEENVTAAGAELKKTKGTAKSAPVFEADHNVDHDKLYTDLKEATLDNLDKNQSLATYKKDIKELEVKILLIEDDINNIRSQCQDLESSLEITTKEYPVLEVDESELDGLRAELEAKRRQLSELEAQQKELELLIGQKEKEYRTIKIHRSQRFTIREEGESDEESKVVTKTTTSYMSSSKQEMSPSDKRKSRLSQSPTITRDIENVMKEVYYGRPGPKIRKTDDGTFIYGTREFVVTKERGKLFARDFEGEDSSKMELEDYLRIHEKIERQTALKTNLQYLNDDIGSEDEEMAEVGEEFDGDDDRRFNM